MDGNWPGIGVGTLLFTAGFWLGRASRALDASRAARQASTPDTGPIDADIEAAIRARRTVEAIKLYRHRTGAGLKQAKQAVDAMAQRIGQRH